MDNLIERINEKINKLNNYKFEYEAELLYTSGFYEYLELNLKNISIMHMLKNSSFISNLLIINRIKTYNQIDELMCTFEEVLDNLPTDKIFCIGMIAIMKYLNKYGPEETIEKTKNFKYSDSKNIVKFVAYINNTEIINNLLTFIQIKDFCEIVQAHQKKDRLENYKILIHDIMNDEAYKDFFEGVILKTKSYVTELRKIKNKIIDENKKKLKLYNKIISDLKNDNLIEYKSYFNEADDDIKLLLLEEVLKHNQTFYNNATNNIAKFDNNLNAIFQINGYNLDNITKNNQLRLLNYGDLLNIKEILPILNKEPFYILDNDSYLTDILICSNKNILKSIIKLIKKEYIDIKFIYNHKEILLSDNYQALTNYSCLNETFNNNLITFQSINFNISNIKNSNPEMLLMDNNIRNKKLFLFKQYHINFDNQKNINYKYFTDDSIFNIIDLFIELGMSDYIKDNIENIYSNSNDIIKRIYISNMVNYNIWNEQNKLNNSIISGYLFPIKNEDLDNYIINCSNYQVNNEIIKYFDNNDFNYSNIINILDNNYLNNDNYLFDDIIISRNKIIRNISSISNHTTIDDSIIKEILFNAIIYNSILDQDQIEIIKEEINNLFSRKRKIIQ